MSLTWTAQTSAVTFPGRLAYSPSLGRFVVCGSPQPIATSEDGITWTARTAPFDLACTDVAWSETLGLFVAVGVSSIFDTIATSPDGITWTAQGDPFDGGSGNAQGQTVAWDASQGLFVAGGQLITAPAGTVIATSADGTTWTPQSTPWDGLELAVVYGLCYSASLGAWVAVGTDNVDKTVLSSPDAVVWTEMTSGPFDGGFSQRGRHAVVATNGDVIVCGYTFAESIFRLNDLVSSYTPVSTVLDGGEAYLLAANEDGVLFCGAFDAAGLIHLLASDDNGATWTAETTPFDGYANFVPVWGVVFGGGVGVATGQNDNDGTIVLIRTSPPPSLADGGRVSIAFDDPALEPDPAWTVIDNTANLVAGIDIRRGRQTELDTTETSTATVLINDTTGLFDPDNTGSPYFGKIDGKQILLQGWNPVIEEWVSLWRGHIDDYGYDFHPAVNPDGEPLLANVAIQCVDLFEYLGNVEMLVGTFGDTPPAGSEGIVFYEDTDFQTRLTQLATDALLPADRYRFFTGNVDVQETKYDPGDSVLVAMRDTVDAEFPGIANLFCDRFGRVAAHGRFARFDPEGTAVGSDWIFTRWKAGDGAAIDLDPDRAQIRPPLSWGRPRSRIFNAATAWPRFPVRGTGGGTFAETDMVGQIVVDTTSRDAYGYRAYPAMSDLITLDGFTTGNDAKDETKLFADYYVANYKDPRTRVEALTFKSIDPDDPRAAATWGLLTAFDISDVVNLKHGYPGGVGLEDDFYIEGSEMSIRPLNPLYDLVELTLNVSPASYFDDDVFTP